MRLQAVIGSRTYVIENDLPRVGSYLRIYENGLDLADHLQDNVSMCQEFAKEEFQVPLEMWSEVPE